jgi:hypothetical protein
VSKDMYLPMRCYANKRELFNKGEHCKCKNFCKYPPNKGTPATELITVKKYKGVNRL